MFPDEELFAIIEAERERQNTTLQLIASENFASRRRAGRDRFGPHQ